MYIFTLLNHSRVFKQGLFIICLFIKEETYSIYERRCGITCQKGFSEISGYRISLAIPLDLIWV